MDGSSTLLPLSEAIAEEFQKQRPSRVTVRASGKRETGSAPSSPVSQTRSGKPVLLMSE
jgi:ABC-type phosphate transport system substrate-binding protein